MEKLIYRKFFKDTFYFFIIGTFSISLIVWVIQAVNYLDFVSEDGHSFKVYFYYTLLSFPKIFSRLIIFMFFVSIFYTISKYEENNELIIFWTNGIKKKDFLNFIIKFSLIFVFFHLLLNLFVVPKTQDMGRSFIRSSNIDYFPSLMKSKQFVSNVKGLTIFIEKKKENGELLNLFLKDNKNKLNSKIISAKKGLLKKDQNYYLVLYSGNIIEDNEKGTNIISYDKTQINLSNYKTKSTVDPKIQEQTSKLLFKCAISIYFYNTAFAENVLICDKESFGEVIEEIYKRAIVPFYIILVSIIGSCLIMKSDIENNFVRFKIVIFILGIFFIILSQVLSGYFEQINLKTISIFAFPFILSLLIYLTFKKRIEE